MGTKPMARSDQITDPITKYTQQIDTQTTAASTDGSSARTTAHDNLLRDYE